MDETLSILLVDDDAVDRMAVRRALRVAGVPCSLHEAIDRDTALSALAATTFDVMLLDYRLPGTDGLTVLREARQHGFTTPVIMLTGQGDEQLAVEILRSGATDYLTKDDVSPDVLSQSIHRALRIHRAEQHAAEAEQALRDAAQRQQFLAEASQFLLESLDYQTVLDRLAKLVTQEIADGCAVDMLDEHGAITRLAVATGNGTTGTYQQLLHTPDQPPADDNMGVAAVIRSGQAQVLSYQQGKPLEDYFAPWFAAGVHSMMIVPLSVRGKTIGAATLISITPGRHYQADDVAYADELAQRATLALENARLYREAQDAVRVRDAFLSIAAHELKTPLTTLYGNVQLLQRRANREGSMNERDQRTLQIVFEQTGRLNKMITALLDLSRLQMNQFAIQTDPVDIVALTHRVVQELQPSLDQHSVDIQGLHEPLIILGDELRLEQVIHNLIQNAIKYSPGGGAVVVTLNHHDDHMSLSVSDHGIGIPKSSLPNLFQRFFRASNVHDHRISGIGVGLFVVHEIVTLHGGTISVESVEGEGTTFTVTLPVAPQPAEAVVANE